MVLRESHDNQNKKKTGCDQQGHSYGSFCLTAFSFCVSWDALELDGPELGSLGDQLRVGTFDNASAAEILAAWKASQYLFLLVLSAVCP